MSDGQDDRMKNIEVQSYHSCDVTILRRTPSLLIILILLLVIGIPLSKHHKVITLG
jgi:hypothetical protein